MALYKFRIIIIIIIMVQCITPSSFIANAFGTRKGELLNNF